MIWTIQGLNPNGGEIFCTLKRPALGPTQPSVQGGAHVSFPGVAQPGRGVDHPPTSSAVVKERIELYFYSPFGSSWPVLGRTSTLISFYLTGISVVRKQQQQILRWWMNYWMGYGRKVSWANKSIIPALVRGTGENFSRFTWGPYRISNLVYSNTY